MASKGNELTGTARPTHLRIFVLLMLFLILTSSVAFTYFQAWKNSERFTADAVLSVLRADPQTQVVGFGEPLKIRVVIQNNGQASITLAPGTLVLDSAGCSIWWGGGSGIELGIPLASDGDPSSPIVLTAGSYVTLTGVSREVTVLALGDVEAHFRLRSTDAELGKRLPKKVDVSVGFEVAPSEFIAAVWAARSPHDYERLQPDMRDLLKLRTKIMDDWRIRHVVEETLTYMAGYAVPLLETAARDEDPVIREQAVAAFPLCVWSVGQMDHFLDYLDRKGKRASWASSLVKGDKKVVEKAWVDVTMAALDDRDARVRRAAIEVLTDKKVAQALEPIKKLIADPDARVRSEAQNYLSKFAGESSAADAIIASLSDMNARVRAQAVAALEHSPELPPLVALKRAFSYTKGATALRLLALLFEQENAALASALLGNFSQRSTEERLAITTVIAGHTDPAALELVTLGLHDPAVEVRRAALMRLLAFPREKSIPLLESYAEKTEALRQVADAVRREIETRQLFAFMRSPSEDQAAARETVFPSRNGTVPMVSPDGKWVAYVETGWGAPGGTGGFGRSNLLSLVHAIGTDGRNDRLISDMFLVGWLSDSSRIASARDGFAALCDLESRIVTEFGEVLNKKWPENTAPWAEWPTGDPRHQFGASMPHRKRLSGLEEFEYGEDAAFSPDGIWFGPLRARDVTVFISRDGQRVPVTVPDGASHQGRQATWSPDGKHVVLMEIGSGNRAVVIDMEKRISRIIRQIDPIPEIGSWSYRKSRWNPWSKDGTRLAFLRKGQIWIARPDGADAKQLTFDTTRKAFPTFSRDGNRIAYISWQPDNRRHYTRIGPTDLWVVDIESALVTRITGPALGRIHTVDWIDDDTLIFDRLDPKESYGYSSSLRRLSLLRK